MSQDYTKTFPARELTPWADYVAPEGLRVGFVYFRVSFLDEDMLVPELTPLVFIGRNLEGENRDRVPAMLYFQDFASHREGIQYGTASAHLLDAGLPIAVFECYEESKLTTVLEFEAALNVLLNCSLERQEQARTGAPPN